MQNLAFVILTQKMTLQVKPITQRSEINQFVRFPFELYKNTAQWVPPMISSEVHLLDPMKNPAMAATTNTLFLAIDGRSIHGRIAAFVSTAAGSVEGKFGWYDAVEDFKVSEALFRTAEEWLREHGARQIKGPMGFTNLDKAGMLIEGFDELPTIATQYNFPYYNAHLERLDFKKSIDYLEHEFEVPDKMPERIETFATLIGEKYNLRVPQDGSVVRKYSHEIFDLINETHKDLYGFIPMSEVTRNFYLRRFAPFINPEFIALVLDSDDRLIGYGLTMPSLSEAFKKARGRFFPFGFWHISRALKTVPRVDMLMIGIREEWRNKGVPALIFRHLLRTFQKFGVSHVESNPELENNHELLALWSDYPHRIHKRRRIYEKKL